MIEAHDICKAYGDLDVLRGVDLSIQRGEIVSIVGTSGAGKTTLLHILGTLDRPDSGSLLIDGQSVFELNEKKLARFRNRRIGFVFQFHHLLPEFTAFENVCIPAYIGGTNRTDAAREAGRLLERLGLADRFDHKPNELSGGEQQRVAVARALVNQPAVVLADEPSGNLDSKTSADLHELFLRLRDELEQTFVIVTHNDTLAQLADRRLVMSDGLMGPT